MKNKYYLLLYFIIVVTAYIYHTDGQSRGSFIDVNDKCGKSVNDPKDCEKLDPQCCHSCCKSNYPKSINCPCLCKRIEI
jgi:hypothetical protein